MFFCSSIAINMEESNSGSGSNENVQVVRGHAFEVGPRYTSLQYIGKIL